MNKEKIRIIITSAIMLIVLVMVWIVFPLYAPSKHDFYVVATSGTNISSSFDNLASPSKTSSRKRAKQYDYNEETPVTTTEFIRLNKTSVSLNISAESNTNKGVALRSRRQENNLLQGGIADAGLYSVRGRSKTMSDAGSQSSSLLLAVNSAKNDKPFTPSTPQLASTATTDGGDPGGDPTGDPLPLKDNLLIFVVLSLAYAIKKATKK